MKILYFLLSTCVLLTVQLSYPQDLRKATSDTGYGERLIRQVSAANKVVIFFDYGVAKAPIGGFLKLISVDSNVLDKASEWKGSAPLPRPVEELINIARSGIEKDRPLSEFKINCCHCNPAKKFATITFGSRKRNQQPSEVEDRVVYMLLDGTVLESKTIIISDEELASLMEYGLPRRAH